MEALRRYTGKLAAADAWTIIGKPKDRRTQDDNFRLGRTMRELGWERTMRRFGGPPISAYVRGNSAERRVPLYAFVDPITGEVTITHSTSPILDDIIHWETGGIFTRVGLTADNRLHCLVVKGIRQPKRGIS